MNDSTFTLTLRLDVNENDLKWLDKIFFHGNHLYNVCAKEAIKRINKCELPRLIEDGASCFSHRCQIIRLV